MFDRVGAWFVHGVPRGVLTSKALAPGVGKALNCELHGLPWTRPQAEAQLADFLPVVTRQFSEGLRSREHHGPSFVMKDAGVEGFRALYGPL